MKRVRESPMKTMDKLQGSCGHLTDVTMLEEEEEEDMLLASS